MNEERLMKKERLSAKERNDERLMMTKISQFTDLKAWQEGHKFVLMIYMETKTFPKDERFSLVDQMRRAAVSITSNIAEGFGRQGIKEKIQFYYIAKGSLTELKNQLYIGRDVGYMEESVFQKCMQQAIVADKLLQGLITRSKTFLTPLKS